MKGTMTCPVCHTQYGPVFPGGLAAHLATSARPGRYEADTRVPAFLQTAAQALPRGAVLPGAQAGIEREIEHRQPESLADVKTYAAKGLCLGIAAALVSVAGTVTGEWWIFPLPWWAPALVLPVATGVAIFVSVFNPARWVTLVEKVLHRDLDGDGQIGTPEPQPYRIEGTLDTGKGNSIYLKFTLSSRAAAWAWHRFCKAVVSGKNFSYNEAVKRRGLPPGDWESAYSAFIAQHWVQAAGERGTPKLSPTGKAWVRHYARTPPPG